ncbi:MAG: hypothetical protein K9K66_06445 [Desulfarculaceae bacterium]|nr:hypothetical protein [Desulfarculaceae bacterium]MCF8071119.1 hypothetical protein [Desulfarculaceae bacterium]MCF8101278.1 hypothetical protein [Desulfarculaceae bacterium]MCF8115173.1 hypothetical protein [Desulfarculaceae bacterium]
MKGSMMKSKAISLLLLGASLALLGGCAKGTASKLLSTEVPTPARLAQAGEVRNCRFLGEVNGYAEPTKSGNVPLARLTARDDLLQRAGEMGATDVVLINYVGNRRPVAKGKAYQCK